MNVIKAAAVHPGQDRLRRGMRRALQGAVLAVCFATGAWAEPACPPGRQLPAPQQVQQAMAAAEDRGMLWRLTKDGRTSYLYGSIHIGTLDRAFPGPTVAKAMQAVDMLALELDATDPQVQAVILRGAHAADGASATLTPQLKARLEQQRQQQCVASELVAAQHPVLQVMTITLEASRRDGLDAMWAQELVLAAAARSRQLPVVSLETVDSQMAALIPKDLADVQAIVDAALRQMESGRARSVVRRLHDFWAQGRLDELADYERWCDCMKTPAERRYMRGLLHGRNPGVADGIDALHGQGRRVFAAVGALHMAGEQGLPRLLERKGYAVERVF